MIGDSMSALDKLKKLLEKIKEVPLSEQDLHIKKSEKGLKLQIALKILDQSEALRETQRLILELLENSQEADQKADCCFLVISVEALKINYQKDSIPYRGDLKNFKSLS